MRAPPRGRRLAAPHRRGLWRGVVPLVAGAGCCGWVALGFLGATWRSVVSGGERANAHLTTRRFFGEPTGSPEPIRNAPTKAARHVLNDTPLYPPWPEGMEEAMFGMGCFWCSENIYMRIEGVYSTQVGYAGGKIPNPSYDDVCTGQSGHNEVVRVIFDPKKVSYQDLLKKFWEKHDPTTLNQQGNDRGTQYRSGIYYYSEEQKDLAESTKAAYQRALNAEDWRSSASIKTEILPVPRFYYAEAFHQQYDARPGARGYCGLRPTGVSLESPAAASA